MNAFVRNCRRVEKLITGISVRIGLDIDEKLEARTDKLHQYTRQSQNSLLAAPWAKPDALRRPNKVERLRQQPRRSVLLHDG